MYQCKSCVKWYSETTGTVLWDIKLKSKWQGYLRCMEQGMALKAIAEDKKIHVQTVNHTHRELKDFLRQYNGVSSKYLQNYLNMLTN